MVPEMLYVCGGGEVLAVVAVTTPEQPQTKAIAASMHTSKSAGRARNPRFRTDSPNRILNSRSPTLQRGPYYTEEKSTIPVHLETLIGSPI